MDEVIEELEVVVPRLANFPFKVLFRFLVAEVQLKHLDEVLDVALPL